MLRLGLLFSDPFSASKLLASFALFSPSTSASHHNNNISSLSYARQLFGQIPQPNLHSWNTLLRAYAAPSADPHQCLSFFIHMLHHCPHSPDKFTFPFVLRAAAQLSASSFGTQCHAVLLKADLSSDLFILNSLINFYASCGDLDSAYKVFANIPPGARDVVSWNSIITALVRADRPVEALELFHAMQQGDINMVQTPNAVTMLAVLSACVKTGDLQLGKWLHSYVENCNLLIGKDGLFLGNALLDMYTKCGSIEDAKCLFDKMPEKDIVTWTTMLVGHARIGEYDQARCLLNTMPIADVAAWNALISAYEQSGKPEEALAVFHELQQLDKIVKPDQVTLVSVLSACAQMGARDLGGWLHVYMNKQRIVLNCHLTTSLIDMYSKCGDLGKALDVFHSVKRKDVFVWSAMIAGLAMHGRGRDAINLLSDMQLARVKPNAVTFTNILCACSHSGLVDEGKAIFKQMEPVYGVTPAAKHYAGMVDLLGRAGRLEEATDFIRVMPISPGASVWGALLGACKAQGNVNLAEVACGNLLELEPSNHGAYVLLSNIYAKSDRCDEVPHLRKHMRDNQVVKEPGCSSIEVDGQLHKFLVGDISHPQCRKIYQKLDEITLRLKAEGYVPDKSQVLQIVDDESMKEQALSWHSEKLAIAFGLINLTPPRPIRVVKNLRVCGDCHAVAKLISKLYNREIILRDRYRFHHFKDGHCSCQDYW
uniref:DYW domain-containing protein n=1 Tax=Kalanchoe fedtschenkoi TaxID=63787 RepID=A0A7N0VAT6_KALFE